jgi:hypothetical protein
MKWAMTKSGGLKTKHVRNQQVTAVVPQADRSDAIREIVRRYKTSVTLSSRGTVTVCPRLSFRKPQPAALDRPFPKAGH